MAVQAGSFGVCESGLYLSLQPRLVGGHVELAAAMLSNGVLVGVACCEVSHRGSRQSKRLHSPKPVASVPTWSSGAYRGAQLPALHTAGCSAQSALQGGPGGHLFLLSSAL